MNKKVYKEELFFVYEVSCVRLHLVLSLSSIRLIEFRIECGPQRISKLVIKYFPGRGKKRLIRPDGTLFEYVVHVDDLGQESRQIHSIIYWGL